MNKKFDQENGLLRSRGRIGKLHRISGNTLGDKLAVSFMVLSLVLEVKYFGIRKSK